MSTVLQELGLELYINDSVNSNVIVDRENKLVFDASNKLPKLDIKEYTIFLTHVHPDHFKYKNLKTKIYVHENGAFDLRNPVKFYDKMFNDPLGIMQGIRGSKIFLNTTKTIAKIDYCMNKKTIQELDINILEDGEKIGNVTAYLTGGHNPNSVLYMLEKKGKKILITGDSAYKDLTTLSFKTWDADYEQSVKTIETILELKPDIIIPGHGKIIEGFDNISNIYNNLLNNVKKEREEILKLCENDGTTLKEIRKKMNYNSASSDLGYGFAYAVIKDAFKKGLVKIDGKRIFKA